MGEICFVVMVCDGLGWIWIKIEELGRLEEEYWNLRSERDPQIAVIN